jgi:hypothetical protein
MDKMIIKLNPLRKANAYHKMISIEPILDFDLEILVEWIRKIKPDFVSIGADSKGHNLPEPNRNDVDILIKNLREFTDVRIKSNIKNLN